MQEEGWYLQEFFVTLNVKKNRYYAVNVSAACVWMKINTRGEKEIDYGRKKDDAKGGCYGKTV